MKNVSQSLVYLSFMVMAVGITACGTVDKILGIKSSSSPAAAVAAAPAPQVYTPVVLLGGVTYSPGGGSVQGTLHTGVSNLIEVCYVDSNNNIATSLNGSAIFATTGTWAFEIGTGGGCSAGIYSCNTVSNGCAPTMGTSNIGAGSGTSVSVQVYGESATYEDLNTTIVVSP